MIERDRNRPDALLAAARERGWITLAELIQLGSHSPARSEETARLAHAAGIELVDEEHGDAWQGLGTLAQEGPAAFASAAEAPPTEEAHAPREPADLYLREISQTPLLTPDEEITLAQQRDAGVRAREQLAQGAADPATRAPLEAAVRAGEAARRHLIEANLRLVVAVARKYMGRGLAFLDLVQEGNLGLQRAVDKYDWRKGFRFSTYGYWWIRQAISRAVADQARTIRLPVHMVELLTRIYNTVQALHHELGREPTPAEIAARLDVPPERIAEAFRAAKVPISLDTPVGEEDESTVADLVADAAAAAPAEEAEEAVLAGTLDAALGEYLSPRETYVLRLRFGLTDGTPHSLGEIAEAVSVSRERVRQIEAEALAKLRQTPRFLERFHAYVQ
jgi:RNA polymerase primary sigma factor